MAALHYEKCGGACPCWESGFSSGNSDIEVDWDNALEDLLPDDVEPYPTQVARYIRGLQATEAEWKAEHGYGVPGSDLDAEGNLIQ